MIRHAWHFYYALVLVVRWHAGALVLRASHLNKALCSLAGESMETIKLLNLEFSTADANYPSIHQESGDLLVDFNDWQEKAVRLHFSDIVAFKWQMVFDLHEGERDDRCYEIYGSSWLTKHVQSEIIHDYEGYKHYRLNFNAVGQLDVIALNLRVRT